MRSAGGRVNHRTLRDRGDLLGLDALLDEPDAAIGDRRPVVHQLREIEEGRPELGRQSRAGQLSRRRQVLHGADRRLLSQTNRTQIGVPAWAVIPFVWSLPVAGSM